MTLESEFGGLMLAPMLNLAANGSAENLLRNPCLEVRWRWK